MDRSRCPLDPPQGVTMADYGALSGVVAVSGSLIAAASAIGLGWMRRAQWLPPEEAVPGGTAKVSALICAVVIGLIYARRTQIGFGLLCWVSGACLIIAVFALLSSVFVNTTYSFTRRQRGRPASRILGGWTLTEEATSIRKKENLSVQQLFENANFQSDLVWTQASQAGVLVISTFGLIALQAGGSIALAAAALVVSLAA
jgi:hypothetical protein